jgi:hypothetical protein
MPLGGFPSEVVVIHILKTMANAICARAAPGLGKPRRTHGIADPRVVRYLIAQVKNNQPTLHETVAGGCITARTRKSACSVGWGTDN